MLATNVELSTRYRQQQQIRAKNVSYFCRAMLCKSATYAVVLRAHMAVCSSLRCQSRV